MGYDNLHNITRKSQHISQINVQFNGLLQAGYDLGYSYVYNPQQISNIADISYRAEGTMKTPVVKVQQFAYDANGNLLSINTGTKATDGKLRLDNSRRLLWDENNYMLASCDNGFVTNYFYDAAGERTVKMSGENEGVQINGVLSAGRTGTTNFTAYISPYLVVNNGGNYTKHIYIGSQRITSKMGNSSLFTTSPVNTTDLQAQYATLTAKIKERFDSLGIVYKGTQQTGGLVSTNPSTATSSYFYHSDHLGSSSLITDPSGAIVQHLEYVPFGETFIDERRSQNSWTTPYLFSGKERDNETGLLYFGARYQDSKYGIWYSVDPLKEKYPSVGSYVYCLNSPVVYIDPDGRFSTKWMANLSRSWYNLWHKDNASPVVHNEGAKGISKYTYNTTTMENGVCTITTHRKFGKEVASGMQDVGDGAVAGGAILTMTGVGAEVGVPLAALGGWVSLIGSSWEMGIDYLNGDLGNGTKKVGFIVAGKIVEKGLNKVLPGAGKTIKDEGFELGSEVLKQIGGLHVSAIERVVDAKLSDDKQNKK